MNEEWWEVVTGATLEQGDLLLECPVYRVETRPSADEVDADVVEERHDLVVLTQTCDLINDKVEDILLASVLSYDDLAKRDGAAQPNILGKNFRRAAVAGNLPPYLLLQQRNLPPVLAWSLVDFHHLFSIPKSFASQFGETSGERLRLVSPYKEHLAQAFARYMMRVGLPSTLHEFEGYSTK